ncbi:hypothetical protein J8L73_18450 [Pseudoalteromonas sp. MMG006]|uniref:hypothetical protein n=1 Tax=Pseudoalteromonas sp. MMG006 TaxID=2822683 RepID=UPI001B389BEA|nr:hypothetical protein [Pseudoalteromonas sp. MMG006]MBQ4801076.1 hypothetical protein [Pseudoalteromonas sp. MMG006]
MKKLIVGIWLLLFIAAIELGLSIPSSYPHATVIIEDCKKDSGFCKNTGVLELSFTGTYRMQLDHQIHLEMDKNDLVNNDANIFNFKSAFIRSTPVIIQK